MAPNYAKWRQTHRDGYSQSMDVIECMECSSPMVYRDNMWQCDNCFSVLAVASANIDAVEIEEGLTMADVMKQYEECERER